MDTVLLFSFSVINNYHFGPNSPTRAFSHNKPLCVCFSTRCYSGVWGSWRRFSCCLLIAHRYTHTHTSLHSCAHIHTQLTWTRCVTFVAAASMRGHILEGDWMDHCSCWRMEVKPVGFKLQLSVSSLQPMSMNFHPNLLRLNNTTQVMCMITHKNFGYIWWSNFFVSLSQVHCMWLRQRYKEAARQYYSCSLISQTTDLPERGFTSCTASLTWSKEKLTPPKTP